MRLVGSRKEHMDNNRRNTWLAAALGGLMAALPLAAADNCEALKSLNLPDTRIVTVTSIVPAPTWTLPARGGSPITVSKSFCRAEGVIEKEMGFEIWLPPSARWNGKYLGTGQGGNAGIENYRDMARGVE